MDRSPDNTEPAANGVCFTRRRTNAYLLAAVFLLLLALCVAALDDIAVALVQPLQHNPALMAIAEVGQFLGNRLGSVLLVALVIALAWRRWKKAALIAVVASVTQSGVVELIKLLTGRPRPIVVEEDGVLPGFYGPGFDGNSFPSGHATFAFTLAAVAAAFFPRARAPIYALASFVAISRVMLDKHYLSDIVAGALLGYAIGALFLWAWMPRRETDEKSEH